MIKVTSCVTVFYKKTSLQCVRLLSDIFILSRGGFFVKSSIQKNGTFFARKAHRYVLFKDFAILELLP